MKKTDFNWELKPMVNSYDDGEIEKKGWLNYEPICFILKPDCLRLSVILFRFILDCITNIK